MDIPAPSSQALYRNFSLSKTMRLSEIDTAALRRVAEIYLSKEMVSGNAMNTSPKLIAVCVHLETKFQDLIEQYPKYPFSEIVQTFKSNIVNEISPQLVKTATAPIFEKCDFQMEFYQKVVMLHNFHSLIFAHLVDIGSIEKPIKR